MIDLFSFMAGVVIGVLIAGMVLCVFVWVSSQRDPHWPDGDPGEDWRNRETRP